MQRFITLFSIFILSGCGATVLYAPQGNNAPDSDTIIADSSSAAEASVAEPDVPVVAQDANVENDSGTIVVDASVEPDVVIAEEDAALAEDVAVVDAAPETGADVVMEAETDASIRDAGVDAGFECHPDPRYARPVTLSWGDGSERPNLFYLTIEVPAGWVPVTLQINLPIRQNNGTFIPATARFDVRDAGLRCAVMMGQRVSIRVPMDFGDRPENGRYVNWVLRATSASHPDTVEDFTLDRPTGTTTDFGITRDPLGMNSVADLRDALTVGEDGNYARAICIAPVGPHPSTSRIVRYLARSPWIVERTTIRIVDYLPFPISAHVTEFGPAVCRVTCVEETMRRFRSGELYTLFNFEQLMYLDRPTLFTPRFEVLSILGGSHGTRSAAVYNAMTQRCEDLGLMQIYEDRAMTVPAPFEFIPVIVPSSTEPECFVHILGLVCPPGRPLLADGRCGPPRTS